ncbi:hypothetical protein A3K86_19350 [Photobacterium jeanii]|uniref:Polymerase/histidinol phosphatase N-terminal domain-containing protein n=1 Tax=Photobacterium jeanii TaxID=858640 RepID=A0A178K2F7_9GAMM|nr:CehA/McbA family metallohydrolase [Photobacterium jeanii]OAN11125.1 hypothetical protein A3K86_19350 [Photobacterium jeanii]PST90642.1 hypothetical protein C9I91_08450 [Photobacterium jeanii]
MLKFNGELTFGHQMIVFEVPANTTELVITGTTVKKGFMYAYLYAPQQQLRASVLWQKAEKRLVITSTQASLGGIAGGCISQGLPAGEWQLHLYNLEGEMRTPKAMQYQCEVLFNSNESAGGVFGAEDSHSVDALLPNNSFPTTTSLSATNEIVFDYSQVKKPDSAWYCGDLHAHTCLSDGHNSLLAAAKIIEQQHLDFFFLTEHNICHPQLPLLANTLVLPGVEVTTDQGHFNVHGPHRGLAMQNADYSSEALIKQGLSLIAPDETSAFVGAASQGSISINHPMMKPWHWYYNAMPLAQVNTMEVCCDPTWSTSPQATEGALQVLSALWNAGHRIAGVGGSDSHLEPHERNPQAEEPSLYGDPATYVYANGLSGEGILAGLRAGHVYFERKCGLRFAINRGQLLPGQDAGDQAVDYCLSVDDEFHDYQAELVADGKVIARYSISKDTTSFRVDMSQYAWLRIDIRRTDGEFEGLINPIYNSNYAQFTTPTLSTWGEVMESLERNGN